MEVGSGVDQGQRRPRAGHCRRLWELLWERRLELGANTYGVRFLFPSTTSRIRGDLDVRVPRRSARARASVRRWLWSSRRGRSGDNRPLYALNWTRLSCHRFVANRVRLSLFVLAYNLGNFLRRLCLPKAVRHWSLRSVQVKLIKMGGRLVRHSRRLIFQLSEVSVPRWLFQGVLDRIGRLSPAPS